MANEEKNSEKVGEQITPQPKQVKERSQRSRKRRVKSGKKGSRKAKSSPPAPKRGKAFQAKPFPTATFESVLPLAKAIFDHAGALREMKRETVFGKLNKSPNSGPSRALVINSGKYGLTT